MSSILSCLKEIKRKLWGGGECEVPLENVSIDSLNFTRYRTVNVCRCGQPKCYLNRMRKRRHSK